MPFGGEPPVAVGVTAVFATRVVTNLSIPLKIIVGFAGLMAITAGLVATSLQRAAATNATVEDLAGNYVTSLVR